VQRGGLACRLWLVRAVRWRGLHYSCGTVDCSVFSCWRFQAEIRKSFLVSQRNDFLVSKEWLPCLSKGMNDFLVSQRDEVIPCLSNAINCDRFAWCGSLLWLYKYCWNSLVTAFTARSWQENVAILTTSMYVFFHKDNVTSPWSSGNCVRFGKVLTKTL